MTRKEFLQTVAGAAVGAAVLTPSAAVAAPSSKIKRGVSFYSYQALYFSGEMSLEDLVAEAASIGAYGLEVIPDAVIPNFLNPPEAFVTKWRGWMDKYHTIPVDWCGSHDTVLIEGHPFTTAQGAERLTSEIKSAHRLGFTNMRLLGGTPLDVVEKCLPSAEKYNVKLNFEIHGPNRLDGPTVDAWVELFERTKSNYVGLNPDMSLFEKYPVAVRRDCEIRNGVLRADLAKYIDQAQADGIPQEKAAAEVKSQGGTNYEQRYLESRYDGYQDPQKLLPLMKYAHHIHGKCYELNEDCHETSIAYEEVLPVLLAHGYEGYISTEYEGQRFLMDAFPIDEFEQVRRHQVLLERLLGA